MKTKLFILFIPALFLLCSAAQAQTAAVLPNQPQVIELPDHPLHAEPHAMATERPIVGGGPETYTYGHGEQPLWEFPDPKPTKPLGDIARDYRQQRLAVRKAGIVLDQQGSK
jgi:hypothetical protein